MLEIEVEKVQSMINSFENRDVYIHLEITNGSYASHHNANFFNTGAFIRNAKINFTQGKIVGESPFRVGLKLEEGWLYAQGITHYEIDDENRLLLAGIGFDGKLAVALEISNTPFNY
ncbi:hypothetical protein UACE39S_05514 [Ureibacillus acetophenoni]